MIEITSIFKGISGDESDADDESDEDIIAEAKAFGLKPPQL